MADKRNGFTLMELLVVIGIIAILVAIVVPFINEALARAHQVKCKTNLRNIGTAMIAFAEDHNGRLPGCYGVAAGDKDWQKAYIGKEVLVPGSSGWMQSVDQVGTLLEYLSVSEGDARSIYRCPSLDTGKLGSGEGSNGMFDYTMVTSLAGGRLGRIPATAVLYRNDSERELQISTPLVIEESPATANSGSINPGFSGSDRLGSWHTHGKGFYCSIDGSVVEIESPQGEGPRCSDFEVDFANRFWDIKDGSIKFGEMPW